MIDKTLSRVAKTIVLDKYMFDKTMLVKTVFVKTMFEQVSTSFNKIIKFRII